MLLEVVGIIFIIIGLLWVLLMIYFAQYNHNFPKIKREELRHFCVLIPARDESLVIEDLLVSLKEQSIPVSMKDVFVIVESEKDPSILIAKKYKASYFVRKELHLKSKGYAINEVIADFVSRNLYYDAYFIIDADNVLDKNFIKEMNESYKMGYDIAIGYRNLKNGNDSIISACSGITFTFLNSNGNEVKSKQSRNITLSGTGLFIAGSLIKEWKSFPFCSLTEDYELTLYSMLHNLTSVYNQKAMFFDEQPVRYKNTINQRVRWIKGYFQVRKKYIPQFRKILKHNPNFGSLITEISGMRPYIFMIVGAVLYILSQFIPILLIHNFKNMIVLTSILKIFLILFFAYFLFSFMTFYIIYKDRDKILLSKKMRIKTILFSPLFFVTYVPCAIRALLKKEVKWERVEHKRRWNEKS